MEDSIPGINRLKQSVKGTIAVIKTLRDDSVRYKELHQQCMVENQRLDHELRALREELKTAKLAQAIAGQNDQDPRSIKLQINTYLREIDKCIALLNRD